MRALFMRHQLATTSAARLHDLIGSDASTVQHRKIVFPPDLALQILYLSLTKTLYLTIRSTNALGPSD